jgi:hypothetical protein
MTGEDGKINRNKNITAWIAIAISLVAVFLSLVSLHYTYFSKVRLTIVPASSIYIANTIGKLPKVETSIGLYAKGSTNKTVSIIDASMSITRKLSSTEENPLKLVPDENVTGSSLFPIFLQTRQLPLMLKGGDLKSLNIAFSFDNSSERINIIDSWGKKLAGEYTDQSVIKLINSYIGKEENKFYNTGDSEDIYNSSLVRNLTLAGSAKKETQETIEQIVMNIGPEKNSEYNYFVAGNYIANVTLELSDGTEKNICFKFSIDGNEEIRMKNKYDSWAKKNINIAD